MRRIIVGTRGSKLALAQTESVINTIMETNPAVQLTLARITTQGDRLREVPLHRLPGAGIFVKELEAALLAGEIDMAVHSLKDIPTDIPTGLSLAGVTMRLDPRDTLVSRKEGLHELASGCLIGTGSPRRTVQLLDCRSDLIVRQVRGNVDTRLRKVSSGELDGIIVAAAALIRLGWDEKITEYLTVDDFLPAVGQGALGREIRSDDREMAELMGKLNHQPTWCSILAERAFLRSLGGGCRAPIAALGEVSGDVLSLQGMVAGPESRVVLRGSGDGSANDPEWLGAQLAQRMFETGAADIINEVKAL